MSSLSPTIYLVDDDPAVRTALARVLRAEGWQVEVYESAEAFLAPCVPRENGCLVLDVTMPGIDGIALQAALNSAPHQLPIVFLTGFGDIPTSVRAIKAGAFDFLTKPVSADKLIAAVDAAIAAHATGRAARADLVVLRSCYATLTPREREVLAAVVGGRLNKQIAGDLGIVEQTVKYHRARIMERMHARTLAELMHIALRLGIGTPKSPS